MSESGSDVRWIATVIAQARNRSPAVPDTVWAQLEDLLKGRQGGRQLAAVELANVAKQLIANMVPCAQEVEGAQ